MQRDSPPRRAMAFETFTPPPPASKRGAWQRIFMSGISPLKWALLSRAGFTVTVTIL